MKAIPQTMSHVVEAPMIVTSNLNDSVNADRYQSLVNTLNGHEEYILNEKGNIISSNLEAVNITGYEEWEVIGKHISILYSDIEQLEGKPSKDLETAISQKTYTKSEIKYKKRSTPFWALIKFSHISSSRQTQKCFRVTLQDSTHNFINEKKYQLIHDEYVNLFNNSFIGIFKASLPGLKIITLNDKAREILNVTTPDVQFKNCFASKISLKAFSEELLQSKRVENFEFQLKSTSPFPKWVSVSCSVNEGNGLIEGIITLLNNHKQESIEIRKVKSQLDNFLYHASHDLRSPLTSILGLVNLIKLEGTQESIPYYTDLIKERVVHLDGILHELVSIVYNNSSPVVADTIDLQEIVKSVIAETKADYPDIHFKSKVKEVPGFVSDRVRIRTILKNLITHSIKHRLPKDEDLEVVIKVSGEQSKISIVIQDNGTKINESIKDFLFKEFYKSSFSSLESGLGLFIAKSMVDTLYGTINVDLFDLTSFKIELPSLLNHEK